MFESSESRKKAKIDNRSGTNDVREHRSGLATFKLPPLMPVQVKFKDLSVEEVNGVMAEYIESKIKAPEAMQRLGVGNSTFYRLKDTYRDNKNSVIKSDDSGKQIISSLYEDEILRGVQQMRDECGGFKNASAFLDFIKPFIRHTLKDKGCADWATRAIDPSPSWVKKQMKVYIPEVISQADKQNLARYLKRVDICTSLVQASVLYAAQMGPTGMLYPHDPLAVPPDLNFNADLFSMKLQDMFRKVSLNTFLIHVQ
jgi:hypothetical protein